MPNIIYYKYQYLNDFGSPHTEYLGTNPHALLCSRDTQGTHIFADIGILGNRSIFN